MITFTSHFIIPIMSNQQYLKAQIYYYFLLINSENPFLIIIYAEIICM